MNTHTASGVRLRHRLLHNGTPRCCRSRSRVHFAQNTWCQRSTWSGL